MSYVFAMALRERISILFVFILTFTSVLSSTQVINKAISETILDQFGEADYLTKDGLTAFVQQVLRNDGHKSEPKLSKEALEALTACKSGNNITLCREFIEQQCIEEKMLLDLLYGTLPLDSESLGRALPAIFYHLYSPACRRGAGQNKSDITHEKPSSGRVWGYGIGFVTLICVVSNIGVLMGPCMKKDYFQRILMFFVALAVGTLAGTGLMVLIPESLGLTRNPLPIPDYAFKTAAVLGGIYLFYLFERMLKLVLTTTRKKYEEPPVTMLLNEAATPPVTRENGGDVTHAASDHAHPYGSDNSAALTEAKKVKRKSRVKDVAWLIMIGDALHNFVDGMAIGAAFTENSLAGVTVSVAIICEELPHELGDIAILLHSGLSMKRALCYNFLAATFCYGGLIIGVLLGENTDANTWIFAAAGGMFAYIALVDMIPEMAEQATHVIENGIETPAKVLLIQNAGLIVGFAIIFSLATQGHNISL